jgi:hypothetical protein
MKDMKYNRMQILELLEVELTALHESLHRAQPPCGSGSTVCEFEDCLDLIFNKLWGMSVKEASVVHKSTIPELPNCMTDRNLIYLCAAVIAVKSKLNYLRLVRSNVPIGVAVEAAGIRRYPLND